MARRILAPTLTLALAAAWLLATALPAVAACHIAGFVESDVEGAPGVVSLTVELQGRVGSCAGTVDVTTVDGTATAGEDYEPVSATLAYETDDDRVETVDVTILEGAEPGASFTLELSNPTGDISGTSGPATVTIAGAADDAADDEVADDEAVDDEAADETTTDDEAADDEAADGEDATAPDDGGGSLGIALAVLGVVVVGVGAFARLRGRG